MRWKMHPHENGIRKLNLLSGKNADGAPPPFWSLERTVRYCSGDNTCK